MTECKHDFVIVEDKGKYERKKCSKCPRVVYDLKPEYKSYYKVQPEGYAWCGFRAKTSVIDELSRLLDEGGDEVSVRVEKVLMTEDEIDALPEFPGY